jgi:hypothetical protein
VPTTIPASSTSGRVAIGRTLGVPLGAGDRLLVLFVALALFGIVGVPITFVIGRRRGRW